jgi:Raf kinase inhibitor-like YbhB/YbcL family protein
MIAHQGQHLMKSLRRKPDLVLALTILSVLLLLSCGSETTTTIRKLEKRPMTLSSAAFAHGGVIPDCYSRVAGNVSPPLEWKNVPDSTRSFALMMRDIDAARRHYVHWVVLNIPADVRYLSEGAGSRALGSGESTGCGSYFGVVPDKEHQLHRYVFTLYALDATLPTDSTPTEIEQLEQLAAGHVLAKAELMGRYGRSKLTMPRWW